MRLSLVVSAITAFGLVPIAQALPAQAGESDVSLRNGPSQIDEATQASSSILDSASVVETGTATSSAIDPAETGLGNEDGVGQNVTISANQCAIQLITELRGNNAGGRANAGLGRGQGRNNAAQQGNDRPQRGNDGNGRGRNGRNGIEKRQIQDIIAELINGQRGNGNGNGNGRNRGQGEDEGRQGRGGNQGQGGAQGNGRGRQGAQASGGPGQRNGKVANGRVNQGDAELVSTVTGILEELGQDAINQLCGQDNNDEDVVEDGDNEEGEEVAEDDDVAENEDEQDGGVEEGEAEATERAPEETGEASATEGLATSTVDEQTSTEASEVAEETGSSTTRRNKRAVRHQVRQNGGCVAKRRL